MSLPALTGCIAQGGAVVPLNAPTGVGIVQTGTSTPGFQLKITDPAQIPAEYFVSIPPGGPPIVLTPTAIPVIEVQADGVQTGGDEASEYLWELTLTNDASGTTILNSQSSSEDLYLEVINFSCENPAAGPEFLLEYNRINSGGTGSASISFKIISLP